MPLINSSARLQGPVVTLLPDTSGSISRLLGPTIIFSLRQFEAYQRITGLADIDSSNTTQPRITSAVQRGPQSDICDIQGFMYDTNGEFISVDSIEYSTVGSSGPWIAGTILTGDPLYIWTFSGSPSGDSFFLPTSLFPGPIAGNIYIRMNVSWI